MEQTFNKDSPKEELIKIIELLIRPSGKPVLKKGDVAELKILSQDLLYKIALSLHNKFNRDMAALELIGAAAYDPSRKGEVELDSK